MESEKRRIRRSKVCGCAVGVHCCCKDEGHDEHYQEPHILDVTEFMARQQDPYGWQPDDEHG